MAQGEFRILSKLESSTISTMFFSFSLAHLFVSLHAFDENCENLILFEILVFSQGVSLGSFALNVHVVEFSFSLFDFLDRSRVDGLNGFFCGVD